MFSYGLLEHSTGDQVILSVQSSIFDMSHYLNTVDLNQISGSNIVSILTKIASKYVSKTKFLV